MMSFRYLNQTTPKKQTGAATLLMSMLMVFVVSMMSIYAAQVGVMEQKISANHYRAKQAFEAAQAGLDVAINELDFTALNNLMNANAGETNLDHAEIVAQIANIDTNKKLEKTYHSQTVTVGNYRLAMELVNGAGNADLIELTAYGYANDVSSPHNDGGNANQSVRVRLSRTSFMAQIPSATMVASGTININDADVNITNETGNTFAAAWSGGATTVTSGTIDVTDADGAKDPNNGIYDNQAGLAALDTANGDFFENFFSLSKADIRNRATVVNCQAGCDHTNLAGLSGIIWIDARNENDVNDPNDDTFATLDIGDDQIGSNGDPVILIVDGDLQLSNTNAAVTGLVYSSQDIDFTNGTDRGSITGSVITEGNINLTNTPDVNFTFDQNVLDTLEQQQSYYIRVAGSWRD